MVDVITYAIFGDCRLRGVGGLSNWLEMLSLQHWSRYRVTVWFLLCTQNLSTDLELRPLNRFWHAILQQTRIHAGQCLLAVRTQHFDTFTLKPPPQKKTHFWAYTMESLWQIHIRITARRIEIWCWNLAGSFTLPSTWSIRKSFRVWVWQGGSSPHIKFWDTLFISKTIRVRKLKFCMPVGNCRCYCSM